MSDKVKYLKLDILRQTLNLMRGRSGETQETNEYERLFYSMGVINTGWVKLIAKEHKPCYKVVKFKLSDNLSYLNFKKYEEMIREKIAVPKLEIYTEDTLMCFKIINEKFPVIDYRYNKGSKCLLPVGYNLDDQLEYINLCSDPNILIGGVPTCGKSTLLHEMICHIIENNQGILWLVDLKAGLEFGRYKQLKQLKGYAQDLEPSKGIVQSFYAEMERRFKILEKNNVQKYEDFIEKHPHSMQRAFLIIDEFTDLMQLVPKGKGKEGMYNIISDLITIGRKARCVGMHLILSSQRLNADSIDSNLKNVCTARIGFRASSAINSEIVIGEKGCETLENYQAILCKSGKKIFVRTMNMDMQYLNQVIEQNKGKEPIDYTPIHFIPDNLIVK